jgi:PhnB protein
MAKLNPYLNFDGTCEEAFRFYKVVFGGEFLGDVHKMKDIPAWKYLKKPKTGLCT